MKQRENGIAKNRYEQSVLISEFDALADGYDHKTAMDAGITADESGRLPGLDQRTGMVLQGKNHPLWEKTVAAEVELGNAIIQGEDSRYYSIKQDRYTGSVAIDADTDTPENFAERAKKDYNFAIENNVDFGFSDAVRREWATESGLLKKIPLAGGLQGLAENILVTQAAKRLGNGFDYSKSVSKAPPGKEEFSVHRPIFFDKEADEKIVGAHLKYITSDKTSLARIATGVSQLPTWFVEFAATGGLASIGDDVAVKAGNKILGHYAKTVAGKAALRTAGWSSGAFTRSFGLASHVGEKFTEQTLDEVLGLKEETGWATKAARAWGDVYIESLSESLFGTGKAALIDEKLILKSIKKLPFGKKFIPALEKAWVKATSGTKAQFIKRMNSKGGYSNIAGEIGEERFGTLLRAITDVEDFGLGEDTTMIERLKEGVIQDIENMWVELGVLSFPAGMHFVGAKVLDRDKANRIRTQIGAKTEQLAKDEESAKQIREMIDTESRDAPFEGIVEAAAEAGDTTKAKEQAAEPKIEEIEPTETKQVQPTKVKDANLNDEVDNVVGQLMTNKADPSKTSLKQESVDEGRKILGLDGVPSGARKAQLQDLQTAKDGGFVDNAEDNADRALNGGAQLDRIESAGALVRMVQLLNRYKAKKALLTKATEPLAIVSLNEEMERIVKRYDSLSTAVHRSGSEAGRRLAMQKLTIDENYDFLSVVTRVKARRGKEPTVKQTEKLKKLTDELEQKDREIARLRDEVAEAMAKDFFRKGKVARYKDMNTAEVMFERESLTSRITELLDEGC